MGKNSRVNKLNLFGPTSMPKPNSYMRLVHMNTISEFISSRLRVPNRVTQGKLNSAGRWIKKPDWRTGFLEYEPNPDAAVHEVAHLYLMPLSMPLVDCQTEMDAQFGFSQSYNGYMKQKYSLFEILPMAMEQKLRRRMGLPATRKKVQVSGSLRTCIETGELCAVRLTENGRSYDLIRLSRNLDTKALERLEQIDNGELKFCPKHGWYESKTIDAKINKRARLRAS